MGRATSQVPLLEKHNQLVLSQQGARGVNISTSTSLSPLGEPIQKPKNKGGQYKGVLAIQTSLLGQNRVEESRVGIPAHKRSLEPNHHCS